MANFRVLALAAICLCFLVNCTSGNTSRNDENNPPPSGGSRSPSYKTCAEVPLCGGLYSLNGKGRYCLENDKKECVEAEACKELPSIECSNSTNVLASGKTCEKRGLKYVNPASTYDCSTLKTIADCKDKPAKDNSNHVCAWSYSLAKCKSVLFAQSKAFKLYSGGNTVCAESLLGDEDFMCWGDDTGDKYSKGLLRGPMAADKIERLALASTFACAEIETKPPTARGAGDGEYTAKCWGTKAPVITAAVKIVHQSLKVNDHVACAMVDAGLLKGLQLKCWGDFNAISATTNPLTIDLTNTVNHVVLGVVSSVNEVSQIHPRQRLFVRCLSELSGSYEPRQA